MFWTNILLLLILVAILLLVFRIYEALYDIREDIKNHIESMERQEKRIHEEKWKRLIELSRGDDIEG